MDHNKGKQIGLGEILDTFAEDCLKEIRTGLKAEIASQSVASEAVREAIEFQEKYASMCQESIEQLERGDVNYITSSMGDGKWTNNCINDDIIAKEKREIFLHNLAITALQAYQPWVPVSERLPEKRLYVLTYRKNGNSKVLRFENDCKWYDSYNEWETDVTHWKPLPEMPKGE